MDILTDSRQISRLDVVDTGRRRRWTDAKKLRIVEESFSGPRLASETARRHCVSKQLVFAWRRLYREGRLGGGVSGFVPATIAPEPAAQAYERGHGRIEIVSANGRRIIVDGDVDVDVVLRVVRGLEALP
jgi:transposase